MKNKTLRLGLVVTVLAIITLCIISGTLAKYVANINASDSARVAKFDYAVTGLDADTHVINLFDTTTDTGIIGNQATEKLVAPGTNGSVEVAIENKSEVAIKAGFELTETNNGNIPIVYGFNGNYYSSELAANDTVKLHDGDENTVTIAGDLSALATAIGDATEIVSADGSNDAKKSITLTWAWAFTGVTGAQTDVTDTVLGEAGTAEVTLRVDCDIEQIDVATI